MQIYGLIGKPLAQSFSKKYFTEKFAKEGIPNARYELFELTDIDALTPLLENTPGLKGLNVTIPYKQSVLPFLQSIDAEAAAMGAVNCIKINEDGQLKGYNTDAPAFKTSLQTLLKPYHKRALILGTGGAAKAVEYTLKQLQIPYQFVSRRKTENTLTYGELDDHILNQHLLIINTTPLGSFPKTDASPAIPYHYLTQQHYLYDLVYNPPVTQFMERGLERGATVKNGYDMLVGQAELGWEIWNKG